MTKEAIDFALTANEENTAPNLKRLRQQSGEGAHSKAKRRATAKVKRRLDGANRGANRGAPEKVTSGQKRAKGTNQVQVAGPQKGTSQSVSSAQGTENLWQLVSRAKGKSNASRPAKKVKDRGEAFLVKTDKAKYAKSSK